MHEPLVRDQPATWSAADERGAVTYVDLRPDDTRPVQVEQGGTWWPGELECYRERDGRWEGRVRWAVGPGQLYLDWLGEDRIRKVSDGPATVEA